MPKHIKRAINPRNWTKTKSAPVKQQTIEETPVIKHKVTKPKYRRKPVKTTIPEPVEVVETVEVVDAPIETE